MVSDTRVVQLRGAAPVPDGTQCLLYLASSSRTRAALLSAAGVSCAVEPPGVDEKAVKRSLHAEGAGAEAVAESLAELKALRVSARRGEAFVVGADQVLECGGALYDKPRGRAEAKQQLLDLRGREHRLVSSVVVVRAGQRLWHHTAQARLVVRPFSEAFLETYLSEIGDDVTSSVGGYRLEGLGVQLFESIEGDYFAILGLPLLPLLEFLRAHGVVAS